MNFKVLIRNLILIVIFILIIVFLYFRGFFFGLPKMNRDFSSLFRNSKKEDMRWIKSRKEFDDGSVETDEIQIPKDLPKWCAKYERKDIQDLDEWRNGFGQQLMELYLHNNKLYVFDDIEDVCDMINNDVTEEINNVTEEM